MLTTTAGRVVGGGLALAALTILGLAVLVLSELDREARLHRDVIAQIESTERVDALRERLARLGPAARIAALSGTGESLVAVEALAKDIDQGLGELAARPSAESSGEPVAAASRAARVALLNARSVGATRERRGAEQADVAAREAESMAREAAGALERILDSGTARINRQALRQIRTGEALRQYVTLALGASIFLLGALFALYRGARRREQAALARVEHLAHFDPLTGLPNRTLLADRLAQEVARAHRGERPFALISYDLDGFKEVNDTWGHTAGDVALRVVAQRSRDAVRASDTVGRLGGDEFLAILPETSLEGALQVAEKLRASLANPYAVGAAAASMSASLGVALFPAHGSDGEALLHAADAALYAAKRAGRDNVKVASRAAAPPHAKSQGTAP
jgi:diguanylate cyclase (GGDEF)-like protein